MPSLNGLKISKSTYFSDSSPDLSDPDSDSLARKRRLLFCFFFGWGSDSSPPFLVLSDRFRFLLVMISGGGIKQISTVTTNFTVYQDKKQMKKIKQKEK